MNDFPDPDQPEPDSIWENDRFFIKLPSISTAFITALLIGTPVVVNAQESRSTMNASAVVKAGCSASSSPMAATKPKSAYDPDQKRVRGVANIEVQCAKAVPFSVSLMGTTRGASPKVKVDRKTMNTPNVKIQNGKNGKFRTTVKAKATKVVHIRASAKLKRTKFAGKSLRQSKPVIVSINF